MHAPTDNYSAIPVTYSPEDKEWIVNAFPLRSAAYYFHCDCHNLVWHEKEMVMLDLADGHNGFWRCDLPIETAV
jgi:hypothetical protein